MEKTLRKLALWFFIAVNFTACTKRVYVPVEKRVEIAVHDTTVLHVTDTLVSVEKARISDFTGLLDTLYLETPLARSTAFVDTSTATLRGTLEQRGETPVKIVWKERIVTKDSLVYQDVPVPVVEEKIVKVVPWFWRFFGALGVIALAGAVFWLLRKFKVL